MTREKGKGKKRRKETEDIRYIKWTWNQEKAVSYLLKKLVGYLGFNIFSVLSNIADVYFGITQMAGQLVRYLSHWCNFVITLILHVSLDSKINEKNSHSFSISPYTLKSEWMFLYVGRKQCTLCGMVWWQCTINDWKWSSGHICARCPAWSSPPVSKTRKGESHVCCHFSYVMHNPSNVGWEFQGT